MKNTNFAIFAVKLFGKTWQKTTSTIGKFHGNRLEAGNLRIMIKTHNSGPQDLTKRQE